jgi:hypothetical protein
MVQASPLLHFASVAWIGLAVVACDNPAPVSSASASVTSTNHSVAEETASTIHVAENAVGQTHIEWGPEDARATLVLDRGTNQATLTLLKNDGVTPLAIAIEKIYLTIDAPLTEIELIAEPVDTDRPGASSRFVAEHEVLSLTKPFSGAISAKINDDPYVSDFAEPYDLFAVQAN